MTNQEEGGDHSVDGIAGEKFTTANNRSNDSLILLDELKDKYICIFCYQRLRYPKKIVECSHHVCARCVRKFIRSGGICPIDGIKVTLSGFKNDKLLANKISNLNVKCSNSAEGCMWYGKMSELCSHISKCYFTKIFCPNDCGLFLFRKNISLHINDECPQRLLDCRYCNDSVRFAELSSHLDVCDHYLVTCDLCEEDNIERNKLNDHKELFCLKFEITCPFDGCEQKFKRSQLEDHIKSYVYSHAYSIGEIVSKYQQKFNFLENMMKLIERDQKEILNNQRLLLFLHDSCFIWPVPNFKAKFILARAGKEKIITSSSFYSREFGYKMNICLFPNGEGHGFGSHMSLFISINKGMYDNVLKWPFASEISVKIISNSTPFEKVIKPYVCHENEDFLQKPIGSNNAFFGFVKFVDHETLFKDNLTVEDTLFISIKINK